MAGRASSVAKTVSYRRRSPARASASREPRSEKNVLTSKPQQRLLQQLERPAHVAQIDLAGAGSEHALGVVQILGAAGQDLHRHHIFDSCDWDLDSFDRVGLGALEKQLLDPGAAEHHVDGQSRRGVDERQTRVLATKSSLPVARKRKPFASSADTSSGVERGSGRMVTSTSAVSRATPW